MLFSIALVSTFVTGGLTGVILGDSALDINVHDTYFVVAHFHIVMGLSAIYGVRRGIPLVPQDVRLYDEQINVSALG